MRFRAAIIAALLCPIAALPETAASPEEVLALLDRGAASFHSLSADVRYVEHTAVINEDSVDTGTMRLKRTKRDIQMLVDFAAPNNKTVSLHGHTLEIYNPKTQEVQEVDVAKYRGLFDQFYLVGFGTSGKELAAAYSIKVLGADTVSGKATTRLELVPKSAEILKNMIKLELWIPSGDVYPLQQKFYFPSGDYKLVTYTNVKMNPPLGDSDLRLRLPKDTKRVFPQK
jgi:outer membrane lipoprotein-sorting protein